MDKEEALESGLFQRPLPARLRAPFGARHESPDPSRIRGDQRGLQLRNTFQTGSTLGHDLQLDVCAKCHPFYTGKQKMVDTAGRVDKFRKKYAAKATAPATPAAG